VQEHQVDVVEARLLEGAVDLGLGVGVVEAAAGDFGGEEDFGAGDCGAYGADGGAGSCFVSVDGGIIDLEVWEGELLVIRGEEKTGDWGRLDLKGWGFANMTIAVVKGVDGDFLRLVGGTIYRHSMLGTLIYW